MTVASSDRIALLGVADAGLARQLLVELLRPGRARHLPVVESFAQLRAKVERVSPVVIFLDEPILNGHSLETAVRLLTETAPVVVLARAERQGELGPLVARGDVDTVARAGDFVPLVAGLIERRLRAAEHSDSNAGTQWSELPPNFPEILRHEINNPLTGILGNAEMLLAHRDRLAAPAAQRLETIVDLAVRLRETIRRLSLAWESKHQLRVSQRRSSDEWRVPSG